jgi:hypothetical protein
MAAFLCPKETRDEEILTSNPKLLPAYAKT